MVVQDLFPLVRLLRDVYGIYPPREQRRIRSCILTTENRITMILIWMAHYGTLVRVGMEFGIAGDLVYLDTYHIVPLIVERYAYLIAWPDEVQRQVLHGQIADFPEAIGYVDTTPHYIQRPHHHESLYWYAHGNKRGHAMISQITVNYHGLPIHASFRHVGSSNDHATLPP